MILEPACFVELSGGHFLYVSFRWGFDEVQPRLEFQTWFDSMKTGHYDTGKSVTVSRPFAVRLNCRKELRLEVVLRFSPPSDFASGIRLWRRAVPFSREFDETSME